VNSDSELWSAVATYLLLSDILCFSISVQTNCFGISDMISRQQSLENLGL